MCVYVYVIVCYEINLVGLWNRSQEMLRIPVKEQYNTDNNRTGLLDDKLERTKASVITTLSEISRKHIFCGHILCKK
jgi:hypothetical protein